MANEAVLIYRYSDPIDFIVADGTGINKGALLTFVDPLTASIATNGPVPVAGFAAREKVASDTRVRLAVYQDGVFRCYASGSITAGDGVIVSALATTYPNYVESQKVVASGSYAHLVGYALETASNGQQLLVNLKPSTTIAQN